MKIIYSCSTSTICWKSYSLVVSWSVGFNPLRTFQEWASPGWVHHAVFLDKTLNPNKYLTPVIILHLEVWVAHIHLRIKQWLVFNCEDHFHFHSFCLFYFFKRLFLVRHRRNLEILLKIRATFRPGSAEVTANNNTLASHANVLRGSSRVIAWRTRKNVCVGG